MPLRLPVGLHRDEFVALGRVSGVFGVKGWVKVFSDSRPRESIFNYHQWWLQSDESDVGRSYALEQGRRSGKHLVAKLVDVDDRDAAEQLIGRSISVVKTDLPSLPEDEFYWRDLIGLAVTNRNGESLGRVERLIETGTHDVLLVRRESGDDFLIPWVMRHFVESVDIADRMIVVDWEIDWNE